MANPIHHDERAWGPSLPPPLAYPFGVRRNVLTLFFVKLGIDRQSSADDSGPVWGHKEQPLYDRGDEALSLRWIQQGTNHRIGGR